MLFNQIEKLCNENNISPTRLCVEITGSKGNLPTWKKGNIRPDWLIKIADYFKVTTDYLLEHSENVETSILNQNNGVVMTENIDSPVLDEMSSELLKAFRELQFRDKMEVMNLVLEKQKRSA